MLGRRHFRIKVLQALYAYFQGGEIRLDIAEKNLLLSINKISELYFLQLSFLMEVLHFYRFRMEEAKTKFIPTQEELNPNLKLLNNKLVIQLQENLELAGRFRQYKFSWTEEQEMVRKVYLKIKNSKDHAEYLTSGKTTYQEDQGYLLKLFRKYIAKSGDLQFYCEERNLFWEDDFEVAAVFVLKTLKLLNEFFAPEQELLSLLKKDLEDDPESDRIFILELFRKSILHSEEFNLMIETRTRNWELERIALTDVVLIKMALTEFLYFSQIPVKVTMNEYIEISKQFSSVKSKLFINGILDKLVADLNKEKKIAKTGRGLMV